MKRRSKYGNKGEHVYDFDSNMNREMYVDFCKELIDNILVLDYSLSSPHLSQMLLNSTPDHGITKVFIQTDSAGGHGGGRGQGMAKSLDQINEYARKVCKRKTVRIFILLSITSSQFSIIAFAQPSKSPDMNALDLGVWYSLASALPAIKFDTHSCKKVLASFCSHFC